MNRKRSVIWLCVIVLLIAVMAAICFAPRFEVTSTDDFVSPLNLISLGADFKNSDSTEMRSGEYNYYTVDEHYKDAYGRYTDAEGNVVEDADKVKMPAELVEEKLLETAEIMRERLLLLTSAQTDVYAVGDNRIRVFISDIVYSSTYFSLIDERGEMSMKLLGETPTEDTDFSEYEDALAMDKVVLSQISYDQSTKTYVVIFNFTSNGAELFKDASKAVRDDEDSTMYLCLVSDGKQLGSPLTVNAVYTGSYIYFTGFATSTDAMEAVVMSQTGPYPINIETKPIYIFAEGAGLGERAGTMAILALVAALGVAIIVLLIRYRGMGIAATLSMICFACILVVLLAIIPTTPFNLSHAVGVFVGIVIAFATQCIMLSGIKAEYKNTIKNRRLAMTDGYKKSILAVVDVLAGALLTAILCAAIVPGEVFGAAIVVIFAIIAAAISTLLITYGLIKLMSPIYANAFGFVRAAKEAE